MPQRHVTIELHRLYNNVRRFLHKHDGVHEGESSISYANGRIIRYLLAREGEDVYQKDLEKEFGITRSTASRVLSGMEDNGLITRHGVPQDARLKKLMLTPRAKQMGEAMRKASLQSDQVLFRGFTEAEKRQLLDYLQRMGENLEQEG